MTGNPALQHAVKESDGHVLGVFCFDHTFLARPDLAQGRFLFFVKTLEVLRDELRAVGSDLLVLDVGPETAMEVLFSQLRSAGSPLPDSVSWCRDFEPFAVARDRKLTAWFRGQGVPCTTYGDHLLIEPHEVFRGGDSADGYQVFTPFYRKWLEVLQTEEVKTRIGRQVAAIGRSAGAKAQKPFRLTWDRLLPAEMLRKSEGLLTTYRDGTQKLVPYDIPRSGFAAALSALQTFAGSIEGYGEGRDLPGLPATSRLSIYFKNGSLTVAQAIGVLKLLDVGPRDKTSRGKFLSELAWREFYYHILARHPRVESECFLQKYNRLKWENREDHFIAWQNGMTGFPIVDAGMRQLLATGWMHNRVRMIVASFLTKDLLVDYRWGERHFMRHLIDGDLAPNNGGWQWAASTGCDPQPYFRIFNPELQSRRFDGEGAYIRRWIPELAHLSGESIHAPDASDRRGRYPAPIVDHKEQRDKALRLYKSVEA